jgi:uncharacterized protein YndB with AHSA1/START domain
VSDSDKNTNDEIPVERSQRLRIFWSGVGFAVLGGALAMLFDGFLISRHSADSTLWEAYITSQFIAIPIGMGILASYFWRKIELAQGAGCGGAFCILTIALALSYLVIKEGVICLIIAAPLLFFCILLGVEIGKALWKRTPWLGVSTLPLLILFIITDASTPHHYSSTVADQVLIHAPPSAVWRYIPAYPAITTPPHYWLWKIGLPVPTQSTAEGAFVGARRDCRFTGNVAFEEKIVAVEPEKILTFEVTRQPDHPEITGHFNLDRGQFLLHDNGDGTTTLTGTTWYRLHVYPARYFDLWATDIIRKVHFRVMDQIKMLAERDTRNSHIAAR